MRTDQRIPCDFCDGSLSPRSVTVDSRRGGHLVVIEDVPALVCDQCGERYFSAKVVRGMEKVVSRRGGGRRMLKVPVRRFEIVA